MIKSILKSVIIIFTINLNALGIVVGNLLDRGAEFSFNLKICHE